MGVICKFPPLGRPLPGKSARLDQEAQDAEDEAATATGDGDDDRAEQLHKKAANLKDKAHQFRARQWCG